MFGPWVKSCLFINNIFNDLISVNHVSFSCSFAWMSLETPGFRHYTTTIFINKDWIEGVHPVVCMINNTNMVYLVLQWLSPPPLQQPRTANPRYIFVISKTHTAPGFRRLTTIKPHPSPEAAQQITTKIGLPVNGTSQQPNTNLQAIRPGN
jgi:hypothetical protein